MGIGNSRAWFGLQRKRQPPPPPVYARGGRHRKRGFFRLRTPSVTTIPISSTVTQPVSYQPLYSYNYPFRVAPAYGRLQPMPSPYLPIAYNNYPAPPQYMMMQSPPPPQVAPVAPPPYMSPPISTPYVPQVQPIYNNPGYPGAIPAGSLYYPSAPARLITDWTGGGKISPGFLGPPL